MGAPRNHNCAKTYHQLRTNSFDKADGCWSSGDSPVISEEAQNPGYLLVNLSLIRSHKRLLDWSIAMEVGMARLRVKKVSHDQPEKTCPRDGEVGPH